MLKTLKSSKRKNKNSNRERKRRDGFDNMRMETKLTFNLFLHGFFCRNSRALVSSLHYFSAVQFNLSFFFLLGV